MVHSIFVGALSRVGSSQCGRAVCLSPTPNRIFLPGAQQGVVEKFTFSLYLVVILFSPSTSATQSS